VLLGCLKFESESMSSRTSELLAARSAVKWRARSGTHNHRPLLCEDRPTPASYRQIPQRPRAAGLIDQASAVVDQGTFVLAKSRQMSRRLRSTSTMA
jgi:hypothetical protein